MDDELNVNGVVDEADDELNVKGVGVGVEVEPGAADPNMKPEPDDPNWKGAELEVDDPKTGADAEVFDDACELEPNKLEVNGFGLEEAEDPNAELPNEGEEENKPNWLVELCVD